MSIEYALLGIVAPHSSHGYEIYRQLCAADGLWQVWRMKQSQLYALLNRLEEAQLLVATLQPQAARPPRKVYGLTDAGRVTFQAWLTSPVEHGRQMRLEFMAKLYFALRTGESATVALIDAQQDSCRMWHMEQENVAPPPGSTSFSAAVHAFRLSQIDAFIQWLDTCRESLPTVLYPS